MITCGSCHKQHETRDEVKTCYTELQPAKHAQATHKQISYIGLLAKGRVLPPAESDARVERAMLLPPSALTMADAHELIDWLKKLPRKDGQQDWEKLKPQLKPGSYALREPDGDVSFYAVDMPARGNWAGQVFIVKLVGAPGDWLRQRIADPRKVAERIAADLIGAARLFGQKARACGQCGSPLSNVRSRAAGYGEECATRLGWPYPSKIVAEQQLGETAAPIAAHVEEPMF